MEICGLLRDDPYLRLATALDAVLAADRPDLLYERIAAGAAALVPYDSVRVYKADTTAGELVPRVVRHPHCADAVLRNRIRIGSYLNGWSASRREPVLAPQAQHHPRSAFIPGTPPVAEALMAIPLVGRGRLVGHLNVQRYGDRPDLFSHDDFELVCRFGDLAAVALDNAEQRAEIERLVCTDELTGLANRRGLQEDLDRAVALAKRHRHPLSTLFIDLDNFKRINDDLGHCAGDKLLREIADAVKERLRHGDLAARLGGDEFVIVLPHTSAPGARALAREVERAVTSVVINTRGRQGSVSASLGVTQLRTNESAESLLDRVDRLMYRAKRRRR